MFEFSNEIRIEDRLIGQGHPCYIIAEAGISHFGDEAKAHELIDLAAEAKADAVKFQVFDIDELIASELTEWRDRLGPRQLPYEAFVRLQKYARQKGITFFATAHDEKSLDFLEQINVPVYKVGSGEVGNRPYFEKIARLKKPVIFSTGMYQFDQIGATLESFKGANNPDVAVLHCVTSYPTPPQEVNLPAMNDIRSEYGVITGYSDHTEGFYIPLAAVALGANIIEKHITLEFNIPNAQDWKVSCGPDDLGLFVSQARAIEAAIKPRNTPLTDTEKQSLVWASKSLVAARDLKKGDIIHRDDLVMKRPGTGISPSHIDEVIGKRLSDSLARDNLLSWEILS